VLFDPAGGFFGFSPGNLYVWRRFGPFCQATFLQKSVVVYIILCRFPATPEPRPDHRLWISVLDGSCAIPMWQPPLIVVNQGDTV
jgi:hypothetical protein